MFLKSYGAKKVLVWLKFIAAFLQPPGLNVFLCLIGIYYWLRSSKFMAVFFLVGSAILLYLLSVPMISDQLLTKLENKYKASKIEELAAQTEPKAIVVLSALDPSYDLMLHQYVVQLSKATKLPILVSGNYVSPLDNTAGFNQAESMAKSLAMDFGVTGAIWVDSNSHSAKESAKFSKQILDKNSIKNVFLVTNAWHMPTAVQEFKAQDVVVVPAPIFTRSKLSKISVLNFTPSIGCLLNSEFFFREHLEDAWSKVAQIISSS